MPTGDSSAPFNVAAKHLFRHLHEPHVLRKNRLVRHFFFQAPSRHDPAEGSESDALERIHELVRAGAAYCRDTDVAAGKEERALRQHAIVTQQCLGRRPIAAVAAELGISYYHCYRERAEICRRIARYICERDEAHALEPSPVLDEFAVLMDRAMHRAACCSAKLAFAELDGIVESAATAQQRIEALRLGALVSARFGDLGRAESIHREAQALWDRELRVCESPSREIAQACIDLIGAKLAFQQAAPAQALRSAQRAASRLHRVAAQAPERIAQLYVESLYELGAAFWNAGNFETGYEYVEQAEAKLRGLRSVSPRIRTRIMVEIWQLRNYLLMNSKSWYPSWQRLKGLTAAFEQAYASGAFFEAATALVALTEHHAFAGDDDETLRHARFAVLLAKSEPSERLRAHISIQVAMMLLWTRHWSAAFSFLPGPQTAGECDPYDRALASYFAAERAFRLHQFQRAWDLAKDERDTTQYVALTLRRTVIAAAAAHELQRRRDAGALIEATIPTAKRLGSAPILRDTYSVAAQITGDSRFKKQASELARLLTA